MNHISPPSSAVKGIVWPGLPGDSGTIMLALLGQLNESQWWPEVILRKMQLGQIEVLLRHAGETTSYYPQVLPPSLKSGKAPMWDDWWAVPTLDRVTARDSFESLRSSALPETHGPTHVAATSGSTGKPVRVVQTALSSAYEGAALLRYHRWHNRDFQARLASIKHSRLPDQGTGDYHQANWGWPVSDVYPSAPVAALTLAPTISQQASWLERIDPDYLLTLPSNLFHLLQHFRDQGLVLRNIKNVSTIMEVVSPELRQLCREVWGASIIDSYSCRETGTLAVQCPDHVHYHVVSENNLVEILREDDTPCEPGETGRVVVTDLHNFAMPMIRYELGDYAEVGGPCPCGRGLPVINRIHGRLRNMMLLPNGDRVWAHMARPRLLQLDYLRQYQFVQTARDTIQANLVVTRPLTTEEEQHLIEIWHERWPYPFRVVFNYLDCIPPGAEGKTEDFRCEV
jgi:phenylacetate-CoA ligase